MYRFLGDICRERDGMVERRGIEYQIEKERPIEDEVARILAVEMGLEHFRSDC